ncbi:MAG: hypothetical protein Kow0042_13580 [Calditrichia bacterium]
MKPEEQEILEKLNLAREHVLNKQSQPAIAILKDLVEVLKDDPVNLPIIHIELAWSYYYTREYDPAIAHLRKALESHQLTPQQEFDCHRLIGFSQEMLGNLSEARKHLEAALSLGIPEEAKRFTYFELGKILFNQGQVIEAEHYFQLAEPLFAEAERDYRLAIWYYLGFAEYYQKNLEKAREYFDSIIAQAQDAKTQASGYFGLAHLHYQKNEVTVLIDLCEKILRLDKTFYDKETLGYFLCYAYYQLKQWDELRATFEEMERNYPQGRYVTEYPKFRTALEKPGKGSN